MAYNVFRTSSGILRASTYVDNSINVIYNYENISDIPDVIFHYDASGLVNNTDNSYGTVDSGGNVSVWKNQVSTNHAIQISGGIQPTLATDGVNSVNFNGTKYFDFTSTFNLYECTIIFILKPRNIITSISPMQTLLSSDLESRTIVTYLTFGSVGGNLTNETLS